MEIGSLPDYMEFENIYYCCLLLQQTCQSLFPHPDLIKPQVAFMTIRIECLLYVVAGLVSQVRQFFLREMMDIAQTFSTLAPVEEVIPGVNLLRCEPRFLPGLDAVLQSFTVQELPDGKHDLTTSF